jgi:hypothetical protein
MNRYAVLISPRAEAAFFAQAREVAQAELAGVEGLGAAQLRQHGPLQFLELEAPPERLQELARLACIQGIFEPDGDLMRPLDAGPEFQLHPDFVWGEKYRGKTNETLTQLLINLALQTTGKHAEDCTLLDPMCGRATSLLWAMRYGMRAVGVDQDGTIHRDLNRSLKKWTKLHRQSHKIQEGWINRTNKRGTGKSFDFTAGGPSMRVVIGDTADTHDLTLRKPFDLLVTDLPYGIEHRAGRDTRSPLEVIEAAAPAWAKALAPGGAMAIAFNANLPKRAALLGAFDGLGLNEVARPVAHRMSESILRDVLILQKT